MKTQNNLINTETGRAVVLPGRVEVITAEFEHVTAYAFRMSYKGYQTTLDTRDIEEHHKCMIHILISENFAHFG